MIFLLDGANGSGIQIDADNFAQYHGNILLLRFKLPIGAATSDGARTRRERQRH